MLNPSTSSEMKIPGNSPDGAEYAQKYELQPHRKEQWVIPSQHNGEFVWHIEDVMEFHTRPYDPRRPVISMDEVGKQVLREVREPLPMRPGPSRCPVRREGYEYARGGVLWS